MILYRDIASLSLVFVLENELVTPVPPGPLGLETPRDNNRGVCASARDVQLGQGQNPEAWR